ncbi:unnamed protein product [Aspergillus oryzae var. brunneus]|uniref:Unnamed protein product n=1 Tax=Aspergillus oryzae var. brunneus TaxID=332754 RepID=A0ABQ6LBW8_ASPOZ|nr:unnamed protein product [Aspergillus oryzae]GMG13124.1 unnamed protein product [Aspergillus oryzae]GMG52764.1 unnamed protein product [Aspergillus oryzae var. brunneus]
MASCLPFGCTPYHAGGSDLGWLSTAQRCSSTAEYLVVPHPSIDSPISFQANFILARTFTHDPSVYHDPMVFKPERFLEGKDSPPETDPMKFVFGFGRRICPGRFVTDEKLFLIACHAVSCFFISPKDPGAPEPDWLPGVISQPGAFDLNVVPRSPAHEELIRSIETDHPWKNADATDISRFMARNQMI